VIAALTYSPFAQVPACAGVSGTSIVHTRAVAGTARQWRTPLCELGDRWQAHSMTIEVRSGPWSSPAIETWLSQTVIPLRLATSGKQGPLVQSVWFVYDQGGLWCATQRDSVLAKRVVRDVNVGWEVSPDQPPYRGVRGSGVATVVDDAAQVSSVLDRLVERYGQSGTTLAQWLLSRIDSEVALCISDLNITSWDYTPRM